MYSIVKLCRSNKIKEKDTVVTKLICYTTQTKLLKRAIITEPTCETTEPK